MASRAVFESRSPCEESADKRADLTEKIHVETRMHRGREELVEASENHGYASVGHGFLSTFADHQAVYYE
jgi:predicted secreted protein